jgi:hypothetical protein
MTRHLQGIVKGFMQQNRQRAERRQKQEAAGGKGTYQLNSA